MKERLDVLLVKRGLAPSREKAKTMSEDELAGKFPTGVFLDKEGIDLNTRYEELLARVQEQA